MKQRMTIRRFHPGFDKLVDSMSIAAMRPALVVVLEVTKQNENIPSDVR